MLRIKKCIAIASFFQLICEIFLGPCDAFSVSLDPSSPVSQVTVSSDKSYLISIGDGYCINFSDAAIKLDFGGMLTVGNRSEFNYALFPNHWWRGNAQVEVTKKYYENLYFKLGAYHESVHPTGGIRGTGVEKVEAYDGVWRTIDLNRIGLQMVYELPNLFVSLGGNYYFVSRNQPEQESKQKTSAVGIFANLSQSSFVFSNMSLVGHFDTIFASNSKQADSEDTRTMVKQVRGLVGLSYRLDPFDVVLSYFIGRPVGFYVSGASKRAVQFTLSKN